MSEKINVKELPHIFLLNRHNLSIDQLSAHTQQLKKDLDKTLVLVINYRPFCCYYILGCQKADY